LLSRVAVGSGVIVIPRTVPGEGDIGLIRSLINIFIYIENGLNRATDLNVNVGFVFLQQVGTIGDNPPVINRGIRFRGADWTFIERITPIRCKRRLLAKILWKRLTIIILFLTIISVARDPSTAIMDYVL